MGLMNKLAKVVLATSILGVGGISVGAIAPVASHADTIVKGNTQSKTVHSMYGDVKMTVKYDRNLTKGTSTITGISSLTNGDPYLKLVDKWYNSTTAQAQYYDDFHKVNVIIKITAAECK